MELSELRQKAEAIRGQRENSRHGRWPESFKDEVIAVCQNGTSISAVSKASGIPHQTIRSWITRNNPHPERGAFQELAVKDMIQPSPITVTWKDAMEISGLSFDHLHQLLREGLL